MPSLKSPFKFLEAVECESLFLSLDSRDKPSGLWVHGAQQVLFNDQPKVAIVGTRKPTPYGRDVARDLAICLGKMEAVVVSGLARGIDTIAHEAAMEAGGSTIAVLGTGLERFYPPENKRLQNEIIPSHGAVVSEFPLNTSPDTWNFPLRNRLIAALSLGVIVVEGDAKSGALITARLAAYQGKDVFAVPGRIYEPMAEAPNILIKEGARPLTKIDDLMEALEPLKDLAKKMKSRSSDSSDNGSTAIVVSEASRKVLSCLTTEPLGFDELLRAVGFGFAHLQQSLLELEMANKIREIPGRGYALINAKKFTHC